MKEIRDPIKIDFNDVFCVICGSYDVVCKISVVVGEELKFVFLCKKHMKEIFSDDVASLFDIYKNRLGKNIYSKVDNIVKVKSEKANDKIDMKITKSKKSKNINFGFENFYIEENGFNPGDIYNNLKNKKSCQKCGFTFNDIVFQLGGIFGCEYCYKYFKDDIQEFLNKFGRKLKCEENKIILKNIKFFSNMSKMKLEKEKIENSINEEKAKKNIFVKNENFLKAIESRDHIKIYENKIVTLNKKIKSIEKLYKNFIESIIL